VIWFETKVLALED